MKEKEPCLLKPGPLRLRKLPYNAQTMFNSLKRYDDFNEMVQKTLKQTLLFFRLYKVPDPSEIYLDHDGWPVIRWDHVVMYWFSDSEINIFLTTCITLADVPKYKFNVFDKTVADVLKSIIK